MGCVILWEWCYNEIILKNMIFLFIVIQRNICNYCIIQYIQEILWILKNEIEIIIEKDIFVRIIFIYCKCKDNVIFCMDKFFVQRLDEFWVIEYDFWYEIFSVQVVFLFKFKYIFFCYNNIFFIL